MKRGHRSREEREKTRKDGGEHKGAMSPLHLQGEEKNIYTYTYIHGGRKEKECFELYYSRGAGGIGGERSGRERRKKSPFFISQSFALSSLVLRPA